MPRLERKRAFRVSSSKGAIAHRPSFASRMFKLFFKQTSSPDEARPKSWSGEPEPEPTASIEPLIRHASANVIIPRRHSSSERASRTRSIREENGDDDDCDSSWRKRQTHCVNCECVFFTALSPLSCNAGRFCSLDCKTSFEYVSRLEEVLWLQFSGFKLGRR
ncbi:hypothetical protein GN244_ATG12395 [Phytophthora infestans]|uniref:FLZ-type domain-containing protein n=1 Tax=Phytophthora infestans TaxID=4787 RepID=A0A833T1Z7_PHYIN|nr:hypothetical protein GN244_ATG12395 [Phytophthora infestans]